MYGRGWEKEEEEEGSRFESALWLRLCRRGEGECACSYGFGRSLPLPLRESCVCAGGRGEGEGEGDGEWVGERENGWAATGGGFEWVWWVWGGMGEVGRGAFKAEWGVW